MKMIPQSLLHVLLFTISCMTSLHAFAPNNHRSWMTRTPQRPVYYTRASWANSGLYASTTATSERNSTSTSGYYPFTTVEDANPKTFFEGEGIQQRQALEKLVLQTTTTLDDDQHMSHHHVVEQEITTSSFLSEIWKARLLLLGAAALYGTNFSLIKIMGDTMPVGISATLRFGLAALATLPWLLQPPKDGSTLSLYMESDTNTNSKSSMNLWETCEKLASTTTVGAALAGFEVGMWNSVGYLAQAVGLETTDASKSAFICSLAVVIVPLIDMMSGKKLQSREISGAVMAVAGVGVLELGGLSQGFSSGDIASLLQPLMFGVAFWRMETAMRKYPEEANRNAAAQLLAVFLTSAIYCWNTCEIHVEQVMGWLMDPMILGSLVFTGIITTALTIYMEAVALKTLTAAETTLILSTEPLWGAGFASLIIGETFGMDAAIGAFLIIAGCIYSNLGVNGIVNLVTGKKQVEEEEGAMNMDIVDIEEETLSVVNAEKAIVEVGLIGAFAQLIAWLEADILIASAASIMAAEEIVEEVITKDLL